MGSPEARFVLRTLLAGIVATISIAAGIYVGFGQSVRALRRTTPESFRNDSYLAIGDTLPTLLVTPGNGGAQVYLSDLLLGRRGVVVFMSRGCGACKALVGRWNREIVAQLSDDILVICVYGADSMIDTALIPPEELLRGASLVTMPGDSISALTGVSVTPTTVGVSRDGTVTFVLSGMDSRLTANALCSLL